MRYVVLTILGFLVVIGTPHEVAQALSKQTIQAEHLIRPDSPWIETGVFERDHESKPANENLDAEKFPNTPAKDFISDAPWVHRAGLDTEIPLMAIIKDADIDAVLLDYIAFYRNDTNELWGVYNPEPNITIDDDYFWVRLRDLTPNDLELLPGETVTFRVVTRFRDQLIYHTYNYYLGVKIANDWPSIPGWYRGDIHYHSLWTDNVFEFGGHPTLSVDTAKAIGLDWTVFTDHSYDVTESEWNDLVQFTTDNSDAHFVVIPGLEFSVDTNDTDELIDNRIHLLGLGLTDWIPGPDIVPGFDVSASRPRSLHDVLGDIESQGALGFAAHPESDVEAVGNYGVVSSWTTHHYQTALGFSHFLGVQIFNGRATSFTDTGVTTDDMNPFPWSYDPNWDDEWQRGISLYNQLLADNIDRDIYLVGGSDAHGDANYKTFNASGVFDVAANNNAYGKIHTAIFTDQPLSQSAIIDALQNGHTIATDGPLGVMTVRRPRYCAPSVQTGVTGDRLNWHSTDYLRVEMSSSDEFGALASATLRVIGANETKTIQFAPTGLHAWNHVPSGSLAMGMTGTFAVWLETETTDGYRSFSNPIWFVQSETTAPLSPWLHTPACPIIETAANPIVTVQ